MKSESGKKTGVVTRGRPRDPTTDKAVLEAALAIMARDGYGGMSLDAVAELAGVTKPTIYRRWASKEDLATAALSMLQTEAPPVPTGDPFVDVVGAIRHFQHCLLRPNGMALIGTLLAEEQRTPLLMNLFRERITLPRREFIGQTLSLAQDAGAITTDCDLEVVTNLLVGSIYAKYMLGEGVPDDWASQVVAAMWAGIAAKSGDGGRFQ